MFHLHKMVTKKPSEFVIYFFLGVLLVFLMINYDLPLSSIYNQMMLWLVLGYMVPYLTGRFKWIPLVGKDKMMPTVWGAAAGVGFIMFYNLLTTASPLGQVFATTAFGDSEIIGQLVFGVLIPIIETLFFFRVLLQWIVYFLDMRDIRWNSQNGIILMIALGFVFTIYHATAKGVTNNMDLIATFVFAVVSVFLVIYFKRAWEAIIMHIVVNSKSVSLDEVLLGGGYTFYILAGAVAVYYIYNNKGGLARRLRF